MRAEFQLPDGLAAVLPPARRGQAARLPLRVVRRRARPRQLPLQALSLAAARATSRATPIPRSTRCSCQARAESDLPRRVELYRRAEQLILDDAPVIPSATTRYERVFQPYVQERRGQRARRSLHPAAQDLAGVGRDDPACAGPRSLAGQAPVAAPCSSSCLVMAAVIVVVEHRQRAAIIDEVRAPRRGPRAQTSPPSRYGPLLLYNFTALEQNVARVAAEADVVLRDRPRRRGAGRRPQPPSGARRRSCSTSDGRPPRGRHRASRSSRRRVLREPARPSTTSPCPCIVEQPAVGHRPRRALQAAHGGADPADAAGAGRPHRVTLAARRAGGGRSWPAASRGPFGSSPTAPPPSRAASSTSASSRRPIDEIGQLAVAFNHMAAPAPPAAHARSRTPTPSCASASSELADLKSYTDNILASLTSGIVTVDLDGRVVTLNPAAEMLTGFFAGEVIGRYCTEVFAQTPEVGEMLMETLASRTADRRTSPSRSRRRNGRDACPWSSARRRSRAARARTSAWSASSATSRSVRELEAAAAPLRPPGRARHPGRRPRPRDQEPADVAAHLQPAPGAALRRRAASASKFQRVVPRELERINGIVERLLELARPGPARLRAVRLPRCSTARWSSTRRRSRHSGSRSCREYARDVPADRGRPEDALPGARQPRAQRARGHGRRAAQLTLRVGWAEPTRVRPGAPAAGRRQVAIEIEDTGRGHPAGGRRPHLQPVLHHQGRRHRPRPGLDPQDRRGPRRHHRLPHRRRRGHRLPHRAAAVARPPRRARPA